MQTQQQQGDDQYDPDLEDLNSPEDYDWRCPCTGMPCHDVRFDRIQDLISHMLAEHGLAILRMRCASHAE